MGDKTGIEWTDATWNPTTGCTKISPGCRNCYAKHQAWPRLKASKGTVYFGREFEDVAVHPERLTVPMHWKKPRRIFVNSMSDLFHERIPDGFILRVFAVMESSPQHTFQILTKRPQRMRAFVENASGWTRKVGVDMFGSRWRGGLTWPLRNVWLGISAEDQQTYDERAHDLRMTPAAVRWVSAEPLLGPINLGLLVYGDARDRCGRGIVLTTGRRALDWVVVGGESGPNARPMNPAWARMIRDQCVSAGVAFLFKQWGEFAPNEDNGTHTMMLRAGKRIAGRLLDGQTYDQYPNEGAQAQ